MDMTEYIYGELMFLIPFLNVVGWWLKHKTGMNNKYIPLILGVVSVVLCVCYIGAAMEKTMEESICGGIIQGVFVAATSVYANQLTKTVGGDKE